MKTIILFLFLLSASGLAFSQERPDPAASIRELKDGVLVVRLRTQANKIAKLEALLSKEDPETMQYNRLAYEIGKTKQEVETENHLLVKAFKDHYRFSDVLFLYDTMAPLLRMENRPPIFLDDSLKADPSLIMENRPYLIAGMGATDPSGSALDEDALVIYDRSFNIMQSPFPGSSGMSGIRLVWKSFSLDDEELQTYFFQKIVARLNRRLSGYYGKVSEL